MANKEMTAEQTTAEVKKDTIDAPALEKRSLTASILTIDSDRAVETQENVEDTIWHDLQNAYRTKKILTGQLGGIERMEGGGTIAIVYYKKFRVAIPLTEMMIHLPEDESHNYGELSQRQNKILGNMLGCEIDFIIKGLDNNSRSLVASRKDAMLKKRQIFYLPDANGNSRVCGSCCSGPRGRRRRKGSPGRNLWCRNLYSGSRPFLGLAWQRQRDVPCRRSDSGPYPGYHCR